MRVSHGKDREKYVHVYIFYPIKIKAIWIFLFIWRLKGKHLAPSHCPDLLLIFSQPTAQPVKGLPMLFDHQTRHLLTALITCLS